MEQPQIKPSAQQVQDEILRSMTATERVRLTGAFSSFVKRLGALKTK